MVGENASPDEAMLNSEEIKTVAIAIIELCFKQASKVYHSRILRHVEATCNCPT